MGKLKGLKALEEKVSKADRELFGKQEEFWTKAEDRTASERAGGSMGPWEGMDIFADSDLIDVGISGDMVGYASFLEEKGCIWLGPASKVTQTLTLRFDIV